MVRLQKALTSTSEIRSMQRASRRTILASAAGSVLAGCTTGGIPGRGDDDAPTSTESPTGRGSPAAGTPTGAAPTGVDALSYSTEVVGQQTSSTPATVRAELANTSRSQARFAARETIVLEYDGGPGNWILPFPETEVGPNDPPEATSDGCWRYPDEYFHARDVEEWHIIDPGSAFRETYRVFTWGEDRTCLPDGDYRFVETIRDEEENELQVSLEISLTDGHASVDGSDQTV